MKKGGETKAVLAIILINYNGYDDTVACVNSLLKSDFKNFEIIIVDNNSSDNSGNELARLYDNHRCVSVIKSTENNGFSAGNNLGINEALKMRCSSILLLNNDTEVEPTFLSNILQNWNYETARTGKIFYYSDKKKIWYANGKFSKIKAVCKNGNPSKAAYVNFASGCCLLLSERIIEKVGRLSDEYFMYYEDVDYCLRMEQAEIKIEYIPSAVLFHKVGQSSGGEKSKLSVYYSNRNRFYLIKKFHLGICCIVYTMITRILKVLLGKIRNNSDIVILDAWKDFKNGIVGRSERF